MNTLIISESQWDHARRDHSHPDRRTIARFGFSALGDDDRHPRNWSLSVFPTLILAHHHAQACGSQAVISRVRVSGKATVRFGVLHPASDQTPLPEEPRP